MRSLVVHYYKYYYDNIVIIIKITIIRKKRTFKLTFDLNVLFF